MWVQDRSGAALPQSSVPWSTPPGRPGAVGTMGGADAAVSTAAAAPAITADAQTTTRSTTKPTTGSTSTQSNSSDAKNSSSIHSSGHNTTFLPGTEGTFFLVDDPPEPPDSDTLGPLKTSKHRDPSPSGLRANAATPSHSVRDSIASIVDDPFFRRYANLIDASPAPNPHAPSALSLTSKSVTTPSTGTAATSAATSPTTLTTATSVTTSTNATTATTPTTTTLGSGHRNDDRPSWIPPRKDSLTDPNPTPWFECARHTMEPLNIAVIGSEGVGKSTFIQHLRRAPRPSSSNITTLKHELDGALYHVTLVELDLEGIPKLDPNQPVLWPKQIGGHMVPRMDGALLLYDGLNEETMRELPTVMAALANSSLPTVLVATKSDAPDDFRHRDLAGVAASSPTCAGHFRTSANAPQSIRECLQAMMRAALTARKDKAEGVGQRRRAASTANLDTPSDLSNGRPMSQHSKHSRASSDFSLVRGNEGGQYRGQSSRSPRSENQGSSSASIPEDGQQTVQGMLRTPGVRLDGGNDSSFLDVDESDAEGYRYGDDHDHRHDDKAAKLPGVTFDELVDRLVAPKMTRTDHNFVDVFLCLYRTFAAPSKLLTAIRARFDQVAADQSMQMLAKSEAQLRIVEVVAKWLSLYPGDFARPVSKNSLAEFVNQLMAEPVFVAAAQQMKRNLEHKVIEDDDTWWENSDPVEEPADSKDVAEKRRSGIAESMNSLQLDDHHSTSASGQRRPSQSSDLARHELPHASRPKAIFTFHTVEDYEREAATLVPTGLYPLNKFRYHTFMEIDPDDMAEEITRIDWIMFGSIRIRDLVRHVSLSHDQKEKCRSLKNVNRMVNHFNHIAQWVANMILIRDKAKHRAPCLEKFMGIAARLRQLNNYNGLAAVLAGINGTAIHRLAQTRALVAPDVQKRFAGLVLLMGTQKSHFAYRLAWENSPLPRIPFIPLHRRDLVSAMEGSKTFVGPDGDRINWKKFEVLGEVILPIMKSQGQPYTTLHRHEVSRELILDVKISTDEEEIYQRSVQVEPAGAAASAESSKKKFPWLTK